MMNNDGLKTSHLLWTGEKAKYTTSCKNVKFTVNFSKNGSIFRYIYS